MSELQYLGVDLGSGDDQTCQVVFLDGTAYSAATLIAITDCQYVDRSPSLGTVPKYGNPHPYLKRKKGRS
jgi:hypothetical protein